jgi:hypothetical protein
MPAIVLFLTAAASGTASDFIGASGTSLAGVAFNESLRRVFAAPVTWRVSTIDIPPPMPRPVEPGTPSAAIKLGADPADAEKEAADKAATEKEAADKAAGKEADENTWRLKINSARAALERDQLLHDAMQTRVNSLVNDFASRDDPAQRAEIERQRLRALDELDRLKKQILKDMLDIADIEEDARKKGIPAGWIRLRSAADAH